MTEYEKWEARNFPLAIKDSSLGEKAWNAALDAVTMKINCTASGVPRQEIIRLINELRTNV